MMKNLLILSTLISSSAVSQTTVNHAIGSSAGAVQQYCDGLLILNQVPNQLDAKASDLDCDACGSVLPVQIMADNFRIFTDGYISELTLFIGYLNSNVPLENDEWTINIHRDVLNQPSSVIYTEDDVTATRTETGESLFGADEYSIVLTPETPVSLAAGIYWIEIHNNSVGSTDTVFWGTGSPHVNSLAGAVYSRAYPATNWEIDNTSYLALQLCDVISDTIYLDGFETVIEQ